MANPVQWSIDQFYGQLVSLNTGAKKLKAELDADKAELSRLWDSTFYRTGHQVGPPLYADLASRQELLRAQIHQNSTLRVMYSAIHGKYVQAVNASANFLRSHGFSAPTLSGIGDLGVIVAFAPLTAVAIILAGLALLGTAMVLTQAQRARTAAIGRLWGDSTIPVPDKLALIKAATDDEKAAAAANPFKFDDLIPIAGLVALIAVGPSLLRLLPRGRRAAA